MNQYQWKSILPNNCPPNDSEDCAGVVFRLLKAQDPTIGDFQSWREENLSKPLPKNISECQTCGISIYRDKSDIEKLIQRIPRFRKSKPKIARGSLTSRHGKMKHTPNNKEPDSHYTWWLPQNVDPSSDFSVT